jgi:hypothetical protein
MTRDPQPIDSRLLYPLPALMRITGLRVGAIRQLRRDGLPVRYVAGRAFVHGRDFARFVSEKGKASKDA